jgi:hypothetical protein
MVGGGTTPYSQLGYRIHVGTIATASAVHGWLSQPEGRYVAYHRVELNLGKGVILGLGEGVRYDGTSPDPVYIINLVPYAAIERLLTSEMESPLSKRDELIRSNFLADADLFWRFSPGWAVYGELMVDDVKTTEGDVPTRLAYQLGGKYVHEGSRRLTLQLEYTRVYNYTYAVYYGRDFFRPDFEQEDVSLGYPLGADTGNLCLWADWDLNLDWTLTASAAYTRIGEGNGAGPWCPDSLEADIPYGTDCQTFGPASGSSYAGVVQNSVRLLGGAVFQPRDNLRFELEAGVDLIDNLAHQEGVSENRPLGRVLASWRW